MSLEVDISLTHYYHFSLLFQTDHSLTHRITLPPKATQADFAVVKMAMTTGMISPSVAATVSVCVDVCVCDLSDEDKIHCTKMCPLEWTQIVTST